MTTYIASICGLHNLHFVSSYVVSGGDINSSFAVETTNGRFFLKLNSASKYPAMFLKEAEGLKALQVSTGLKVPQVIATGICEDKQYLLVEWLEKASSPANFWTVFAEGLAQLHKNTHTYFGWSSPNYIGSLVQQNEPAQTWEEFYAARRIMPLVEALFNKKIFSTKEIHAAEKVCTHLQDMFPNEPPALLHGDLWAGNFMAVQSVYGNNNMVQPSVFDPAIYYGHREMDIGMMLLFGGFDNRLYEVYNDIYPLEKNWRSRLSLTQLYPLLVHAILFGGGYTIKCRNILKERM